MAIFVNGTFIVSGTERWVESWIWESLEGPRPREGFACDGCSKSPDRMAGFPVWVACIGHDWLYRTGALGSTWASRRKADAIFRRNVVRMVRFGDGSWLTKQAISLVYFVGVRAGGWGSYARGAASEIPSNALQSAREIAGLFLEAPGALRPATA